MYPTKGDGGGKGVVAESGAGGTHPRDLPVSRVAVPERSSLPLRVAAPARVPAPHRAGLRRRMRVEPGRRSDTCVVDACVESGSQ